jgi:hypothetical protein
MKNNLVVLIESETEFKILNSKNIIEANINNYTEKLSNISKRIKEIHIFISDLYVFSMSNTIQVKRKNDALKAAEYQLTTMLHSNKIKDYLYSVYVTKSENGYNTISYYTENNFSEIITSIEDYFSKKAARISPLFELFKDSLNSYQYENKYITIIEDNKNSTFPANKIPNNLITENIKQITDSDIIKNFNKKSQINFKKDNLLIITEKIFTPVIVLLIILNIALFAYGKITLKNAEKEYKSELKKVKRMEAQLKPFRDLKAKKEKYVSYINLVKKISSDKNSIEKLIYDLAKDYPDIWVKSLYYRNGKMNITISYKNVQIIADYLESKKYIQSSNIRGRVTRTGNVENATIEVTFAK